MWSYSEATIKPLPYNKTIILYFLRVKDDIYATSHRLPIDVETTLSV